MRMKLCTARKKHTNEKNVEKESRKRQGKQVTAITKSIVLPYMLKR